MPGHATTLLLACDNALEGINAQGTWGFVTVSAQKNRGRRSFRQHRRALLQGNLAAVPNADFTADTCADVPFTREITSLV